MIDIVQGDYSFSAYNPERDRVIEYPTEDEAREDLEDTEFHTLFRQIIGGDAYEQLP